MRGTVSSSCFFFFNDTATTEIYTLSLHDALPISKLNAAGSALVYSTYLGGSYDWLFCDEYWGYCYGGDYGDRKSTRLNSSHVRISYAVFCLTKKNSSLSQRYSGRPHSYAARLSRG